jgi:hypothetical protein
MIPMAMWTFCNILTTLIFFYIKRKHRGWISHVTGIHSINIQRSENGSDRPILFNLYLNSWICIPERWNKFLVIEYLVNNRAGVNNFNLLNMRILAFLFLLLRKKEMQCWNEQTEKVVPVLFLNILMTWERAYVFWISSFLIYSVETIIMFTLSWRCGCIIYMKLVFKCATAIRHQLFQNQRLSMQTFLI